MNNPVLSPPKDVKEAFRNRAGDLCMLPSVANEALSLANSQDCTVEKFSQIVGRDVKLAADILATANSVLFGDGGPVSSLRQAVVRLGIARCKNLVLISATKAMMHSMPLQHEWVREVIREHSQRTAVVSSYLNEVLGIGFDGEEYAAGLLHDLGRLLLAVTFPQYFEQVNALRFTDEIDVLAKEHSIFGTDHCSFGAWFAEQNGFPGPIVSVIHQHHASSTRQPSAKLVALVAAADDLASHVQCFERNQGYNVSISRGALVLGDLGYPELAADKNGLVDRTIDQLVSAGERPALGA